MSGEGEQELHEEDITLVITALAARTVEENQAKRELKIEYANRQASLVEQLRLNTKAVNQLRQERATTRNQRRLVQETAQEPIPLTPRYTTPRSERRSRSVLLLVPFQ